MAYYAYSIVYRTEENDTKHFISWCDARSDKECKGIARDEFEDQNPKFKILSLLVTGPFGEVDKSSKVAESEAAPSTTYNDSADGNITKRYINPEFALGDAKI